MYARMYVCMHVCTYVFNLFIITAGRNLCENRELYKEKLVVDR